MIFNFSFFDLFYRIGSVGTIGSPNSMAVLKDETLQKLLEFVVNISVQSIIDPLNKNMSGLLLVLAVSIYFLFNSKNDNGWRNNNNNNNNMNSKKHLLVMFTKYTRSTNSF